MTIPQTPTLQEGLNEQQRTLISQAARVFGFNPNEVLNFVQNPPQQLPSAGSNQYYSALLAQAIRDSAGGATNFRPSAITLEGMGGVIANFFTSKHSGAMDTYSLESSWRDITRSAMNLGVIRSRHGTREFVDETEVFRINYIRYSMVRQINPQLAEAMLPRMVAAYSSPYVARPDLQIGLIREMASRTTFLPNPDGGANLVLDRDELRLARHSFLLAHHEAIPRKGSSQS